ncbi:atp-dependent dna helicase [Holotrichia oblita]|uniref:Atp-dependent dna helicase n=1 Tax=Holotrichia oblita TaxID=644536 RepID=A0ACB9SJ55_HOLOL|nr:atp-dependent dna helicase [Holotrichia oblita]
MLASEDGPNLSAEEWKRRFGDWKYATKAKYRKISEHHSQTGSGPPLKIKLTELEERGLAVWGKVPVTGSPAIPSYDGIEVEYVKEIAKANYDAVSVFNIIEESSCVLPSETDGVIITYES